MNDTTGQRKDLMRYLVANSQAAPAVGDSDRLVATRVLTHMGVSYATITNNGQRLDEREDEYVVRDAATRVRAVLP